MIISFLKKEEKKVEYIELIYDLIFVYIIGRNNSLIHPTDGGFIPLAPYLTYLLTTLAALHIWYLTTLFINRYGSKSVSEYVGIFINMYLLYYMADGTRVAWQDYYYQYNIAWGLILVNLAAQYLLKLRQMKNQVPWQAPHLRYHMWVLLAEAAIVFVSLPVFAFTGIPLSPLAIFFGIAAAVLRREKNRLVSLDFAHLTERVMLYVVFTFGEMIISVAGYFEGGATLSGVYFSLMGFLIVAGLFLIYGYFYDHIIDREQEMTGSTYMLLHIFLLMAMNNIAVALEFMRELHVDAVPKNIFLVVSFLVFYAFLFSLQRYAYGCKRLSGVYWGILGALSLAFAGAIALCYHSGAVSIAVTVVYIYAMFGVCVVFSRRHRRQNVPDAEA